MITIYTDGSSRGNPGPGGWGAVIFYQKSPHQESRIKNQEWVTELGGRDEHTTNNRMELMGAIRALEFASNLQATSSSSTQLGANKLQADVFTDSEYVVKGMTEWIHNWQKKGWRTAGKKPVLNRDLWQELLQVGEGKDIEWKYVAGHSGHELNDRCDEIATSFADNITPSLYDGLASEYK